MNDGSPSERLERLRGTALRRAMWMANANAALWAIGNGLVSTTLVIFLALDLGAKGIAISLILAAPHFAGLLRLTAPALLARLNCRKAFCIGSFVVSAIVLCAVPIAAVPSLVGSPAVGITVLVVAWCVYHLFEYLAVVALWSWLGDLMPAPIRGRLVGDRQRWLRAGVVVGIAVSVALATLWNWLLPAAPRWEPLALSAAVGALMMVIALLPLASMPAAEHSASAHPRVPWRTLRQALVDRRYRRLLIYQCWAAAFNGLTGAAQGMYPLRILGIPYGLLQSMRATMHIGQSLIAPAMGRLTDRWGNRPVMIVAQLIVATGPLFFFFATPQRWWLLIGAFVAWIAYAGLNVGLDGIKLKLAPAENNAPYLAVYYAVGDLVYGCATVAGGLFYDRLSAGGSDAANIYAGLFLTGWLGRTLGVVLLIRLIEPQASRLSQLWSRSGQSKIKEKS